MQEKWNLDDMIDGYVAQFASLETKLNDNLFKQYIQI